MFALTEIDVAAGLTPQSPLYAMRRERADFVEGTEACRHSVMTPELGLGISHDLRRALGARMATQIGQLVLASMYRDHLSPAADQTIRTIADGGFPEGNDMLLAMVRHADLVTLTPKQSRREDIGALATAGLTNPQIVALSELVAFVNYEARVAAGLNILAALS